MIDELTDEPFLQLPPITESISLHDIFESMENEEGNNFVGPSYEGHYENLAEIIPENILSSLAGRLISDIKNDIESRKDWDQAISTILKELGIKRDRKDFPFENASGIFSPIVMRTALEFFVNAIPELLPIEGPVKQHITGSVTDEIEEQAKRVETWVNYFLTQEAPEYYASYCQMLMWLGICGSAFRKTYFDPVLKRPTSRFLHVDDFIVEYGTTALETCPRMTEVIDISKAELSKYFKIGYYRNITIPPKDEGEDSTIHITMDKLEGVQNPSYDQANMYKLYACHVNLDFNEIEQGYVHQGNGVEDLGSLDYRPYIVTMDAESQKILSIYRNWEENDPDYKRIEMFTHFSYMQGLGLYGWGAAHLIGGLAEGSTQLLRQTLDGQTLANFPGGLRAMGTSREADNNLRIGPTEFKEIDTGGLPIQDTIMTLPYKEPSPQISETRKELEAAASGIMGAANMQIADFNPNVPVGTTYALLGLLYKVQSTVIRRIRDAMEKEFKIFYRLFAKHVPEDEYTFQAEGIASHISSRDFHENIRIIPVADPHVTSEVQRLIRSQLLVENANAAPDLHDRYTAYHMMYKSMKLTDSQINRLLPPPEQPVSLDPTTENENLIKGKGAVAFVIQDHPSHKIVHAPLLEDPTLPPEVKAGVMAHMAEHTAFEYRLNMEQLLGMPLPPDPAALPIEMQNQIAFLSAQAIMAQQKENMENAPPPPLDPALVMLEEVKVKDKGIDEKAKADELKAQTEAFKAHLNFEADMKKIELEEKELEMKAQGLI